MLTQDQIQALKSPFPPKALSVDTSRGFELTSIKAAFVIERLNEVFGTCGIGWRYVHSPFEEMHADSGRLEIITKVAFQYRPLLQTIPLAIRSRMPMMVMVIVQ